MTVWKQNNKDAITLILKITSNESVWCVLMHYTQRCDILPL
jgi:hypothetical protein